MEDGIRNEFIIISTKGRQIKYRETIKGLVAAFLYIFCVVISATSVQLLESRIPNFELNMFRYIAPLAVFSLGFIATRKLPAIPKAEICGAYLYTINNLIYSITLYIAVRRWCQLHQFNVLCKQ